MAPSLLSGSIVFGVVPSNSHTFSVGDIVTYLDNAGRIVSHRVTAVYGTSDGNVYQVRGDLLGGTESISRDKIVYSIEAVRIGMLSYETDGAVGRWLAGRAVNRPLYWRLMLRVIRRLVRDWASNPDSV